MNRICTFARARGASALLSASLTGLALSVPAAAQSQSAGGGPIQGALAEVNEEVRVYNDHLTILASPWMEGRLPGTRGMELAKEYMEYYFRQYGLEAPYEGGASFRQPFALGSVREVKAAHLEFTAGQDTIEFEHGEDKDVSVTGLGSGGEVTAELAFVGYGIKSGPDDFTSYAEDQDLEGKIAVMLRFEPLAENGWSKWNNGRRNRWTRRARFAGKIEAAAELGASAIVIINTPGAADSRATSISEPGTPGSPNALSIPVLHMSTEAGARLIDAASGGSKTLAALTTLANDGPVSARLQGLMTIDANVEERKQMAENVVAVLPGKGPLATERVVIGAHLDHLGQGDFGSLDREFSGKKLHPGADDNATGCAGILLIAQKMAKDYAMAGDDANLRTIVFIGFSAEESGLNGSRYYAANPLDGDIKSHVLMMNFDMIGRMTNSRVKLSGTRTGAGLHDFLQPIVAKSPLSVVQEEPAGGGSDHREFYRKGVPVLFSIIADLHNDYHTSRDVSSLINRVEAVHAANLFYSIATAFSSHPAAFPYVTDETIRKEMEMAKKAALEAPEPSEGAAAAGGAVPMRAKVQFGVSPTYGAPGEGVLVGSVTKGAPAEAAGIKGGDRLVTWNGEELSGARAMGGFLSDSEAGDTVTVGVIRDGEEMEIEVVLRAREGGQ